MALLILLCIPLLPWKVVWFFHCCKTNRTKRGFFHDWCSWLLIWTYFRHFKTMVFSGTFKCYFGRGCMLQHGGHVVMRSGWNLLLLLVLTKRARRLMEEKGSKLHRTLQAKSTAAEMHWGRRFEIPHTQLLHPHHSYPHWFQMPMPTLTSTLSTKGTGFSWVWQVLTNDFNSREQPKAEKNK